MNDFDDFDGDFDDGFENVDFEDDSDYSFGMDYSLNEEAQDESTDDDATDIGWEDVAMIGGLAEEFAEEERERRRLEKKINDDIGVSNSDSKP